MLCHQFQLNVKCKENAPNDKLACKRSGHQNRTQAEEKDWKNKRHKNKIMEIKRVLNITHGATCETTPLPSTVTAHTNALQMSRFIWFYTNTNGLFLGFPFFVCLISATLLTRSKQSDWQEEHIVCVSSKFRYFQFGLPPSLSLAGFSFLNCCLCILCHYQSHALLLKCHIL